ncbi:MAG: LPS O-antigen length regulator, partial [Gammaproteobacteria bacterium]|nr:LPS O-antigen length regulator [Gammaproteobacteria bacterium]
MDNLPQSQQPVSEHLQYDDEIDLKELFFVLWNAKLFIIAITGFFAVLSVVIALMQPNIYESSAVLAPRNGQSGLSGLAAQYGGLAAMAGIQLPGGEEGSKTLIAMEKMKSKQFFEEYLYEAILVELMAAKNWDASSNTLKIDADAYDLKKSKWIRDVDPPAKPEPSMQEA